MAVSARLWIAAAATCALVVTGCGSQVAVVRSGRPVVPPLAGTEPNGEQLRSGQQLLSDARSSLTGAASVRLSGMLVLQGFVAPVEVVSDRSGNLSGSLGGTGGALQLQFDRAPDALFLRPTGDAAELVSQLGLPGALATAAPGGDSWQLTAAEAASVLATLPLTLPALANGLLPADLVADPGLGSGDVDGTPVVTASAAFPRSPGQLSPGLPPFVVKVAVTGPVRLVGVSGGRLAEALSVDVETSAAPSPPTPAATPAP